MSTFEADDAQAVGRAAHDNPAELVPLLLSIAKASRAFLTLLLAEIDLHPGQDQLLLALDSTGSISVSALAEHLSVRPSTVSKMLDRLIERRLVDRIASSKDARRTLVVLTAQGLEARRSVQAIWNKLEADLKPSFGKAEFGAQLRMLEKVDALLAAKLRRLR